MPIEQWYENVIRLTDFRSCGCSSCVKPICACSGHPTKAEMVWFPGEIELISKRLGERGNANWQPRYASLYLEVLSPNGCIEFPRPDGGPCPILSAEHTCTINRPIECRMSPLFPEFDGENHVGFMLWQACSWTNNVSSWVGSWIENRLAAWGIILEHSESDEELRKFLAWNYPRGGRY